MFGSNETTTGGRALKFYASVRMDVRKIETLKQSNEFIGSRTRVRVVKNKVAPPFQVAEFDIMYGEGISKAGDVLDLAANIDVVNKSGAWYSYGDLRLGQGRENAKQYIKENPELLLEIENKVREHYRVNPAEHGAHDEEAATKEAGSANYEAESMEDDL